MTLIAATRVEGIPVLLGDLLLTAPAKTGVRSFHPVQPHVAARLPQYTGVRVAGAARKAILINDYLALGWTGSYFSAGAVLKSLSHEFGSRHTNYAELQSFLSTQVQYQGDTFAVHLVGWIFEDEHRCFRWNSQWPHELFEAPEHFSGTGEGLFRSLLNTVTGHMRSSGFKGPDDLVPHIAASEMGNCIAQDVASGKLTENYFGYGFETIFWDGLRYRYVDEVTYVIKWQIFKFPNVFKYKNRSNFFTSHPQVMIKYKAFKTYCVMQTMHRYGILKDEIYVDVIGIPRDNFQTPDLRGKIPFSFISPLCCSYVEVIVPGGLQVRGPMITSPGDEEMFWITEENGKTTLHANVKNFYWSIAPNLPNFGTQIAT
jgi:hypothetical protein